MSPPKKFIPANAQRMVESGMSHRKVSRLLGASRQAVSKALQNLKSGHEPGKIGRVSKMTSDTKIFLIALARTNKGMSSKDMTRMLASKYECHVTDRTVRNWLHELGFRPILPKMKKRLTAKEMEYRLDWAKEFRNIIHTKWVFTDEKIFTNTAGIHQVWIEQDDEAPIAIVSKSKISVAIWGGISWYGKTKLHFFEQKKRTMQMCT